MNKSKFLELVKNPHLVEEKDLTKLAELTSIHPYCQIGHVLNAKGLKKLDKPDFVKALNLAAVYSYDRSVLRSIIDGIVNDNVSLDLAQTNEPQESEAVTPSSSEDTPNFEWVNQEPEIEEVDDLNSITEDDSEIPLESPEVVENESDDSINAEIEVEIEAKSDVSESEKVDTNTQKPDDTVQKADLVIDEDKEASEISEQAGDTETGNKTTEQTESKSDQIHDQKDADQSTQDDSSALDDDPLALEIEASGIHAELLKNLSQLQESKQQYEEQPDVDPKSRTEQIEIIDNFIKNSPVLSKPNLSAESEVISQEDLSKKSAKFSEELASENLAKIYFKQGKKKDAEKIYKKLIRMFPQKKSYFADQIKKLKKK